MDQCDMPQPLPHPIGSSGRAVEEFCDLFHCAAPDSRRSVHTVVHTLAGEWG